MRNRECFTRLGVLKVAFATQADADAALSRLRGKADAPTRAYECPRCGSWHVTKRAAA